MSYFRQPRYSGALLVGQVPSPVRVYGPAESAESPFCFCWGRPQLLAIFCPGYGLKLLLVGWGTMRCR